jgi:hypothetical protein
MPDSTLTTTTPDGRDTTRPVPPSWASVAPLLQRWQIALVPYLDGTWDVRVFGSQHRAAEVVAAVRFADLPQAIWEVSQRCEAQAAEPAAGEEGG